MAVAAAASASCRADLTPEEQKNVRAALQFLRLRRGGWLPVAKALRFKETTLARVCRGRKMASASLAVRVARFAKVGVDDVLTGRFPAQGTCPYCGHLSPDSTPHRVLAGVDTDAS